MFLGICDKNDNFLIVSAYEFMFSIGVSKTINNCYKSFPLQA